MQSQYSPQDTPHPVDRAASIVGSKTALAAILGVTKGAVSQWVHQRRIPLRHCAAVERATGGAVTRKDLRPDDYGDIWPELAAPIKRTKRAGGAS